MKYLHEHKKEFAMGVLTSIVATTIMDTIKKSFEVVGDSFIPSWMSIPREIAQHDRSN